MDGTVPPETIVAVFFLRRCRGSSRALRCKKHAHSGPSLRFGRQRFGGPAASMNGPPSQGIGPGDDNRRTTQWLLSVT